MNRELGGDVILGPHRPKYLDCFVGARTTLVERNAQRIELGLEPTRCQTEDESPSTHVVDRRDHLGDHQWIAHGQNQNRGAQADSSGA